MTLAEWDLLEVVEEPHVGFVMCLVECHVGAKFVRNARLAMGIQPKPWRMKSWRCTIPT